MMGKSHGNWAYTAAHKTRATWRRVFVTVLVECS